MFKYHLESTILLALVVLLTGCASPTFETSILVISTNFPTPTITPTQMLPISTSTSFSPGDSESGLIAFSSDQDGDFEIWVMPVLSQNEGNADGSDQSQLTDNDSMDILPTWSSDGTQISFDSNRDGNWEIYVMASDGSHPQRLTNKPADDWITSWAPDGSQIVFESSVREDTSLLV